VRVYRVNSLPSTLEPGAMYVVAAGAGEALQYFVGANGVARRAFLTEGDGIDIVGSEIRLNIDELPLA
jgi:hypothetical protein